MMEYEVTELSQHQPGLVWAWEEHVIRALLEVGEQAFRIGRVTA